MEARNRYRRSPYAVAEVKGGSKYPKILGSVEFFPYGDGTIVRAEIANLPQQTAPKDGEPPIGPFGFHIHEFGSCDSKDGVEFAAAGEHYNPTNEPHPLHAGDLPVLMGNDGYAYLVVYTSRFTPREVVGKTVIIHENPDDFRSQPSGDSGDRIACGVIRRV